MEFIRDVGAPKPDSSNSNHTDFPMGSTRCPYCPPATPCHMDLGMLLLQFNTWLHTIAYLSAAPSIFSVVTLIARVWHCFETFDDILTNICKTLWNIKSEMLHDYKWNRANKRSFAEHPGEERWAGPRAHPALVCPGWVVCRGPTAEEGLVGRQPSLLCSKWPRSFHPAFFPSPILLWWTGGWMLWVPPITCLGMNHEKWWKLQVPGLGAPCLPVTAFCVSLLLGWLSLPLGSPSCLVTQRGPSPTYLKPAKSDVLIISEPILVGTGSTGSLPAYVFLRENHLPSFFAYLANGSTFLSAPVEGEEGSGEGGGRVPSRWLSPGDSEGPRPPR